MCGPHGLKFLRPVELRLPHRASVNPESWSFALKSSDSPTGLLVYSFSLPFVFHALITFLYFFQVFEESMGPIDRHYRVL